MLSNFMKIISPLRRTQSSSNAFWRLCSTNQITIESKQIDFLLNKLKTEYTNLQNNPIGKRGQNQRLFTLSNVMTLVDRRQELAENVHALADELNNEKDREMIRMIEEEQINCKDEIVQLDSQILDKVWLLNVDDNCSSMILEVTAGVGGQEAMLFSGELYEMYLGYAEYKGWDCDVIQVDSTELGGIRHSSVMITGADAFGLLKNEAGVHRVQRIPSTEKSGRIHTSTVSVAVIPRPDDLDLQLKDRDLKIETKRASGAGGQHVNTTDSAVRIVHLPTGVAVECQTERSQIKNKQIALKKLEAKLCQQHMDAEFAKTSATRKSQVGMSNRNEKIRTYNFNQDRITDHRIEDGTTHNLATFLAGGQSLDDLITKIRRSRRKQEIMDILSSATNS